MTTNIAQLSWLDLMEEQSPASETQPEPELYSEMPKLLFKTLKGWADGDVSAKALERLALVVLGDPIIFQRSDTLEKFVYRVIASGIIGDQVYVASEYERPLNATAVRDDKDEVD